MQIPPLPPLAGAAAHPDVAAPTGEAAPAEQAGLPPAADRQEQLHSALRSLQESLAALRRNLAFSIDESTGQVVVRVIAAESGEVIRQIPSEELLKLARSLEEGSAGALMKIDI